MTKYFFGFYMIIICEKCKCVEFTFTIVVFFVMKCIESCVFVYIFMWKTMLCFNRLWEDRWCFRENFSSWSRGTENYIHQSAPANQILQQPCQVLINVFVNTYLISESCMLYSKHEENMLFIPLLPFLLTASYSPRHCEGEWSETRRAAAVSITNLTFQIFKDRVGKVWCFIAAPSACP